MNRKHLAVVAIALILGVMAFRPATASAQDARVDSLEARIRELEARLDSLLAVMAARAADSVRAELEALRAAARQAASAQPADTAQASRSQNLNILNPEISVTGDVVGTYTAAPEENNFFSAVPREFEFSFQAAIDPYTRTKVFVAHEEDFELAGLPEEEGEEEEGGAEIEIEEGYLYWVGLPLNLGLKLGKFRQEIGLYNRWHTHALFEVERPLPTVAFLGEDGLIQTGGALTLPFFRLGPTTNFFVLELTRGDNAALFDDGNEVSFLGNLRNFWDLSEATYLQLGATGVYGQNDEAGLDTYLLGLDVSLRWRPPGRGLYRDLLLKAEWYFARKEFAAEDLTGNGGYVQANYRLNRRWIVGVRADYLDNYGVDEPEVVMLVPTITWWQSEWVRLRLQYNYTKAEGLDAGHTFLLQSVWAVGPHRHETY